MNLITTIEAHKKYFQKIEQVGDTLEVDGGYYLIIGIQKYRVLASGVKIWYTVQNLAIDVVAKPDFAFVSERMHSFTINRSVKKEIDDGKMQQLYPLGGIFHHKGITYRVAEFKSIIFASTDLEVSFYVEVIVPISQKQARAKLVNEKRKRMKFELI